ncbi:hypothetical protein D5H75_37745 [Bailinhaonella thermotolerans]|uniref:Uncharacterized protein n=2 Tax=Bailinhaonella thermotolerans TaxID=1070861 RepID=A0A3A3ZZK1_9ACTN|nr:hypothetical protein D5H75_37745 [Bailinhaonella thermotolerans]
MVADVARLTSRGFDPVNTAERARIPVETVHEIIRRLGTFLSTAAKVKVHVVDPADLGVLLPLRADPRTARSARRGRRPSRGQPAFAPRSPDQVVVPWGYRFRRGGHSSDMRQAAALVAAAHEQGLLGPGMITRFLGRVQPPRLRVVTFADLCVVWMLAAHGRFTELAAAEFVTAHYAAIAAEAYQVLESGRAQAGAALTRLLGTDRPPRGRLTSLCAAASPLAEPAVARLRRDLARAGGDDELIRAALGRFRAANRHLDPPGSVAELTQGQVLRIAQAAGLAGRQVTAALTRDIQARLADLDLLEDGDQLVPLGVSATFAGRQEDYWAAMRARAQGRTDWARPLLS